MTYFVRSTKKVWCPIRQYSVLNYPEERVRQRLLQKLIEFNEGLKRFILVEVNTMDGRADLVIYDENHVPFLTIELKAATEIINDLTLNQVMRYWETLKSPFVAIHNSRVTRIYHVVNGNPRLLDENDIIGFLEHKCINYTTLTPMRRLEYHLTTYERYINHLVDTSYLSEHSEQAQKRWFSELQNAILTEQYIPTKRILPIDIEGDFGTSYVAYKNAANGCWNGMHRNFRVKVKHKGTFTFRVTIMASGTMKNDAVFGNRNGGTYLNVAMQKKVDSTYNLQMNLDKFTVDQNDDTYKIWHSGVKSRTKKEKVIKEVENYAPSLFADNCICLGTLPTNRRISTEEFSIFIENLIVYSATRDRVK
ncbi:type I restriction enzyme HsdR N-terminal domain-containing protein [Sporosarcina saromensis]|uniref:Type I restriction enzyme HsdR N-terminal domain-containing protein n=1 Tax=Sporosarcina saromensis TaxID=359365 RepID=A0ABU4GBX7_9BACL|nr:type I restriction enzyme HsdR N-terminal domain-containing protein [Sporosarcina saromensis]MDW0113092.1 type I restriction enzyme HsdR N-terminal domain-containing protein [Sporosarcina saromensis]